MSVLKFFWISRIESEFSMALRGKVVANFTRSQGQNAWGRYLRIQGLDPSFFVQMVSDGAFQTMLKPQSVRALLLLGLFACRIGSCSLPMTNLWPSIMPLRSEDVGSFRLRVCELQIPSRPSPKASSRAATCRVRVLWRGWRSGA